MGSLLNDREKLLFDARNIEVLRLAGAENTILWSMSTNPYDLAKQLFPSVSGIDGMDCLYGEANPDIANKVDGKQHGYFRRYDVLCLFEEPAITFDITLLGGEQVADAILWFSRADLDKNKVPKDSTGDHVKSGDIVQLFSKNKDVTTWYQIINANRTGFINDSKTWTQYRCDAIRSTALPPEVKIP